MPEREQLLNTCRGIQHIGIPTENMKKTCEFYMDLGFKKVFKTTLEGTQTVIFLRFQDVTLELYEGEGTGMVGAIEHIAVDCRDIDAAYRLAEEKGYVIVSDGIEKRPFWEKGVRFFTIEGPNGERIELNQYL